MANSAYDMSADRASRLIRRYLEEDLQVEPDRASDQHFYKATAALKTPGFFLFSENGLQS